ncbi:hypothetical protein [aff. Roholtiella sp. LEGE 12411]|uniref:hypothetical protein n=1 Tax=aff. Roholtiella sp. LEGE 12411 TaxID=1828822 RepID=UPI00187E33B5|nr:hypothetical protein [aff. Roholtiella sp. LEGE 12411]MBE9036336.1 hypothetical protein [aff. Roholtiella sp. LEGE 12411]
MEEVLALLEKKKQEFAQTPFMKFLRDKSIDPRQRLAWAPGFAPFAMSFKDFNRVVLRKEPATSKLQEMINQHTYEDGRHWIWFIQDLKLMGYDYSIKYTDTLKFLWSEETQKVRFLIYNLFAMCTFEEDILMKLAIIEAIEATGTVALFEIAQVGKELQEITQHHHPYFGESHYAKETGHIQAEMDDVEHFIKSIKLTEAQKKKAFSLVEKVFADFTDALNEMSEFAKNHPYDKPFTAIYDIEKMQVSV